MAYYRSGPDVQKIISCAIVVQFDKTKWPNILQFRY